MGPKKFIAVYSNKGCPACCFELNSKLCRKTNCHEDDRADGKNVIFLLSAETAKEFEAEVSRLTEENEKLKDRLRQSCTACEKKIALENVELRARVAELERKNGNQQDTIRRAFDGLPADIEARISAIEKWLADWSKGALPDGAFPLKPGGE